jgi:hypothetical protein
MGEFCSCPVPGRSEPVVVWDRTDGRGEVVRWLCSVCREPLRPVEKAPEYAPDPALIETFPSLLERLGHAVVAVLGTFGAVAGGIAVFCLAAAVAIMSLWIAFAMLWEFLNMGMRAVSGTGG